MRVAGGGAGCGMDITDVVQERCQGVSKCVVPSCNSFAKRDPCPNIYKYNVIDFVCVDQGASLTTVPDCPFTNFTLYADVSFGDQRKSTPLRCNLANVLISTSSLSVLPSFCLLSFTH